MHNSRIDGMFILFISSLLAFGSGLVSAQLDLSGELLVEASPSGRYVVVGQPSDDALTMTVSSIDTETLTLLGQIEVPTTQNFAVSDDGRILAHEYFGRLGWYVGVTEIQTNVSVADFGISQLGILAVALNPPGTQVAYGTGAALNIEHFPSNTSVRTVSDHKGVITSLAWNPLGDHLAAVLSHRRDPLIEAGIQIWEVALTESGVSAIPTLIIEGGGRMVDWSPDGEYIAATRTQGFDIFSSRTGELLSSFETPSSILPRPGPVVWSSDGLSIAAGVEQGVEVWNVETGQHVALYETTNDPSLIVWRSGGTILHDGSQDGLYLNGEPVEIGENFPTPTPLPTETPIPSPTSTTTPLPTATPTDTPTPAAFQRLRLTSMCSDNPASTRRWRVRNSNPYPVSFTWDIYNSPNQPRGSGVVPAAVDSVQGEVLFSTTTEAGPNTLREFVNGGAVCN